MTTIAVAGVANLRKEFVKIDRQLDRAAENGLIKDARALRGRVRRKAPLGKTGNIRRAVTAKRFRRKARGRPSVFVGIDRRIAPHAHLVEFGTKARGYVDSAGGMHSTGKLSPNSWFWSTVDRFREFKETKKDLIKFFAKDRGRAGATQIAASRRRSTASLTERGIL